MFIFNFYTHIFNCSAITCLAFFHLWTNPVWPVCDSVIHVNFYQQFVLSLFEPLEYFWLLQKNQYFNSYRTMYHFNPCKKECFSQNHNFNHSRTDPLQTRRGFSTRHDLQGHFFRVKYWTIFESSFEVANPSALLNFRLISCSYSWHFFPSYCTIWTISLFCCFCLGYFRSIFFSLPESLTLIFV